jgi:hypothetical protein
MDDHRFDRLVRSLRRHRSRRALMRTLLGGGLALLVGSRRSPAAAAGVGYRGGDEDCWQPPGYPDPCGEGFWCNNDDSPRGRHWGICRPLFPDNPDTLGELCGDFYCASWQRCCSQCSGICAPRDGVCPDGQCRSGSFCPPECPVDDWCAGCLSGFCLNDGTCA